MWGFLQNVFSFTGVEDVTVWQDIIFSSFLIPITIGIFAAISNYWKETRPLRLLLKGFGNKTESVLVFLSQLHACNEDFTKQILNQKYLILTPDPMPGHKSTMKVHGRQQIDPVWSEGDGECLADIYNVFGKCDKGEDMRVADTIIDWDTWFRSVISIGFNPKTEKLIEKCSPIHFEYKLGNLSIPKLNISLNSYIPNDAGVIQKTFMKDSKIPVFILAGLGVLGTSASGYWFRKECVTLGKLYGPYSFCVLLSAKTDEGRSSAKPVAIYPKPPVINRVVHPFTYYKYQKLFQDHKSL